MLFGIILTDTVVLPRIHTCPPSASCPKTYDPNTTNALQLLQAFMSYWLKAGVMVSSVGILRLSSYQAWFILMHQGNTFKNLDLTVGAIKGSLNDACFLLFKKNNRLLSVFVFALLGVGTAISLVTGLSIEKEPSTLVLTFSYNVTVEMPDSLATEGHLNNAGQLEATSKVISWALERNGVHDGALRGALVTPDSRSVAASNAVPGGPTIAGWFECQSWGNYTIEDPIGRGLVEYQIWVNDTEYIAHTDMAVFVASTRIDTAVTQYLWVSNTTGLIPNATTTSDGRLHIALCTHWLVMQPEEPRKEGLDYLMPSRAQTTGCDSDDQNTCIADSVSKAVISWWGGVGGGFWRVRCRGGVLGPVPSDNDTETYCAPTQELWKETAISMLDGIMQTATRSGEGIQDLHAVVEGISRKRWWINATIPAATAVVYVMGLAYTCFLSQGNGALKELDLHEIIKAAQTDHIRDLVSMGELKKTPIRYHRDIGFVRDSSSDGRDYILYQHVAPTPPEGR